MSILRTFTTLVFLLGATLLSAQMQSTVGTLQVKFTTVNVPGAAYTGVSGINLSGVIVGNYGSDVNLESHGFILYNGVFSYFDYPNAPQSFTVPTKINDSGIIVGIAGKGPTYGFTYDGTSFTKIQDGGAGNTATFGINNAGEIVGGQGSIFATHGFDLRAGVYKKLNVPGTYSYIYASGVNNKREIAGWTDMASFECPPGGVICQPFDYPVSSTTRAEGLNDKGMIVGWYNPYSSFTYAFLFKNGKFLSFSIPGAVVTTAGGINNLGQVVGCYSITGNTSYQGFITDPITDAEFDKAFASAGVDSQ